jgi:hypothetical protein
MYFSGIRVYVADNMMFAAFKGALVWRDTGEALEEKRSSPSENMLLSSIHFLFDFCWKKHDNMGEDRYSS